jgi:hypothetical protein
MSRWDRPVDSYVEEYRARGVSPQKILLMHKQRFGEPRRKTLHSVKSALARTLQSVKMCL